MPLLFILLSISTALGFGISKASKYDHKQPTFHRRHTGRNGLLDINKDLVD
jgi:hypothetical protein